MPEAIDPATGLFSGGEGSKDFLESLDDVAVLALSVVRRIADGTNLYEVSSDE